MAKSKKPTHVMSVAYDARDISILKDSMRDIKTSVFADYGLNAKLTKKGITYTGTREALLKMKKDDANSGIEPVMSQGARIRRIKGV